VRDHDIFIPNIVEVHLPFNSRVTANIIWVNYTLKLQAFLRLLHSSIQVDMVFSIAVSGM